MLMLYKQLHFTRKSCGNDWQILKARNLIFIMSTRYKFWGQEKNITSRLNIYMQTHTYGQDMIENKVAHTEFLYLPDTNNTETIRVYRVS